MFSNNLQSVCIIFRRRKKKTYRDSDGIRFQNDFLLLPRRAPWDDKNDVVGN